MNFYPMVKSRISFSSVQGIRYLTEADLEVGRGVGAQSNPLLTEPFIFHGKFFLFCFFFKFDKFGKLYLP